MQDRNVRIGPLQNSNQEGSATQANPTGPAESQLTEFEEQRLRAARVKLIEETSYRLTDLLTCISARLEILGDKLPPAFQKELATIRAEVGKSVELNRRFFLVAQECRSMK